MVLYSHLETGGSAMAENKYDGLVPIHRTVVYREVRFALPAGTTEEEAGVTVLPEPQMVKDGTQIGVLENLPEWTETAIHDAVMNAIQEAGLKNGAVLWPLRIAVSGIYFKATGATEIMEILGKEESVARIREAIRKLES